jgi:hypothetical protein
MRPYKPHYGIHNTGEGKGEPDEVRAIAVELALEAEMSVYTLRTVIQCLMIVKGPPAKMVANTHHYCMIGPIATSSYTGTYAAR